MNKEILSRLEKWKKGKPAGPEKVQLYPTNRCNLNCIFCTQQNEDYGHEEELSKEEWEKVAREVCQAGPERVLISGGGEPFCRKKTTLKIMEIFKNHDIRGRLITNGVPLDQEARQKIIKMGWDDVVFSIDGPDAKTHDRLRGRRGAFDKSIRNLQLLRKKRRGGKPRLEINFVLTRINYRKIPEMIGMVLELGLESINFEPLTVNNPLDRKLKLGKNERRELTKNIIPRAQKINKDDRIRTNLSSLKKIRMESAGRMKEEIEKNIEETLEEENSLLNAPCYEPWLWPKIEANGDVWPCSTVPLQENIKEKSFQNIWYGKAFNNFRERILNRNLPQHCQNCVTTHLEKNKKIKESLRERDN